MDLFETNQYNAPKKCELCGGRMVFKGIGEYTCEDCGVKAYDDYGKVRLYVESHQGANAAEIEKQTGVSQKSIRTMLTESRLEVAKGSRAFLKCEVCGANIRSGRLCFKCETDKKTDPGSLSKNNKRLF